MSHDGDKMPVSARGSLPQDRLGYRHEQSADEHVRDQAAEEFDAVENSGP
jgi:hypothetical protein